MIFNPDADHPQALPFADVRTEAEGGLPPNRWAGNPLVGEPTPGLPLDAGLETTAEERASRWIAKAQDFTSRLLRDHDRLTTLLAEAQVLIHHFKVEYQESIGRTEAIEIAERLLDELAEARAREARAREQERKACAVLLPRLMPLKQTGTYSDGWIAAVAAYRAAIRARGEA